MNPSYCNQSNCNETEEDVESFLARIVSIVCPKIASIGSVCISITRSLPGINVMQQLDSWNSSLPLLTSWRS